ncbi:MAG: hypothetical protein R3E87_14980 [Burkholderiaceae bacterium]
MPDDKPISFELVAVVAAIVMTQTSGDVWESESVDLAVCLIDLARNHPRCQPTEKPDD